MAKRAAGRKTAKRSAAKKRSSKATKRTVGARKRSAASTRRSAKRVGAAKRRPARKASKRPRRQAAASGSPRTVVVTVGKGQVPKPARLKKVARQLASRGMKVESVLEGTGQITGTSTQPPATLEEQLGRDVSAEEHPRFQLAPPGSEAE